MEPSCAYPSPLGYAGLKPPLHATTAGTQSLQAAADSRILRASCCEGQLAGLDAATANRGLFDEGLPRPQPSPATRVWRCRHEG